MSYALYGKKQPGWSFVYLRRTNSNGVTLSVRLHDPWWMKRKIVPFYIKDRGDSRFTTFTWSPFRKLRFREQFG